MKEPRCIRYFSNREKAIMARDLIISEGFEAEIKEDKFGTMTLDNFGMPLRFRLYVERQNINRVAEILAEKLRRRRI